MAQSGIKRGETTPFFSVVGVVTMAIGVTSEPVPAVVGASSNGRPLALGEADAIDVVEPIGRFGEIGDELGGIERAAAADRNHQLDLLVAA